MLLSVITSKNGIFSLITWPKFSFTSFLMVSRLNQQGIVPATVIDVGANLGQFTIASVKTWPQAKVYSFEPLPAAYRKMESYTLGMDRVEKMQKAIGDKQGTADFHISNFDLASSILPLGSEHKKAFPTIQETEVVKVQVDTLDNCFENKNITRPCLLKVDVQGYEANVLKGAEGLLHQVDYVLLETSFKPLYDGEETFKEINDRMESMGFKFARPVDFMENETTGEIVQMDALFIRK